MAPQSRAARVARAAFRWIKWLVVFAAIIQLGNYANDVHTRAIHVPSCQWEPVENPYDPPNARPPYSGRYCDLVRGTILLQLHDASGQQLLAERMYPYPYYERPIFIGGSMRSGALPLSVTTPRLMT